MAENVDLQTLREGHRVLARFAFEPVGLARGYAGRSLRVDLGANAFSILPTTEEMKDLFVGGKGFDLRLMWDEVNPDTRWDSPENAICISSGPLGGTTTFSGAGKSIVTTISPLTGMPIDSNVGGYFGPLLKFTGFDALVVVGKAAQEVMVVIDAQLSEARIETAPLEPLDSHLLAEQLTRMYAGAAKDYENVSVVSSGRAAEHCLFAHLNFSWYDWRRGGVRLKQAGRGGCGTVMRAKQVKALVIHSRPWKSHWKIQVNSGPQPEESAQ